MVWNIRIWMHFLIAFNKQTMIYIVILPTTVNSTLSKNIDK